MSLQTSVVITEDYNGMVNSEELFGTKERLTLCTRCRLAKDEAQTA